MGRVAQASKVFYCNQDITCSPTALISFRKNGNITTKDLPKRETDGNLRQTIYPKKTQQW